MQRPSSQQQRSSTIVGDEERSSKTNSPSELTDWVNTIAARATVAAGYSTQSASALHEEVRRAKEERQSRRNSRLNGSLSLSRGNSYSSAHSAASTSPEKHAGSSSNGQEALSAALGAGSRGQAQSSFTSTAALGTTIDGRPFIRESICCSVCGPFGAKRERPRRSNSAHKLHPPLPATHDLHIAQPPSFPSHSIPKSPQMNRGSFSSAADGTPKASAGTSASAGAAGVPVGNGGATTSKGAALLARYGGAAGPTGHLLSTTGSAPASPGASTSPTRSPGAGAGAGPVSLANFIGGRAAGPRLGKLVGDGRSQPPEAALAYESGERDKYGRPVGIALPGLASPGGGGGGLAGFMKGHLPAPSNSGPAGAMGRAAPTSTSGTSPEKEKSAAPFSTASTTTYKRPTSSSGAAASSGLASPLPISQQRSGTGLGAQAQAGSGRISPGAGKQYSTSPVRSSAVPQAFGSPARSSTAPTAQSGAADFKSLAPRSPVAQGKSHSWAEPTASSPGKPAASAALPSPTRLSSVAKSPAKTASSGDDYLTSQPARSGEATSPGAGEVPAWKAALLANKSRSNSTNSNGNTSAASPSGVAAAPSSSPAFSSSQFDRVPTASLTRLSAKKMVGQRIREAQERESGDGASSSPAATSPPIGLPFSSPGIKDRWTGAGSGAGAAAALSIPGASSASPSPISPSAAEDSPVRRTWSPNKLGNALPGLSGASSAPLGKAYAKSPEPDVEMARPDAPPVRLPGMGGAASPFARRPPSPSKQGSFSEAGAVSDDAGGQTENPSAASAAPETLSTLTKGRARGPKRTTARSTAEPSAATPPPQRAASPLRRQSPVRGQSPVRRPASPAKEEAPAAAPAPALAKEAPAAVTAPRRHTAGKRVATLISGSGSNLQALIDATVGEDARLPNAQIDFVVSNRKAAFGLQRAATSNPPIPTAILALKTWQTKNPGGTREQYDEVLANLILDHYAPAAPDLIVLAGFMHIVSEHFLRVLGHKTSLPVLENPRTITPVPIINLHPAKPGEFDGAHAIERAFEAFKQGKIHSTGVMVHEVIAEVDRGQPILVREVPIFQSDTVESLEDRMHKIEHEIIVDGARVVLERPIISQPIPNPWNDVEPSTDAREGVDAEPKFSSVKDALSNWPNAAAATTQPPSAARATLQRRASGRPSSFLNRDSPLEVVQEHRVSDAATSQTHRKLDLAPVGSQPALKLGSALDRIHTEKSVSVQTLTIGADGSATELQEDSNVVYDTELQVIVHRYRDTQGLVETELAIRRGSKLPAGRESSSQKAKLDELSKRFGAKSAPIPTSEPSGLSDLLGGVLVTRHGSRTRFDSSNTQLYIVRKENGNVFADQGVFVSAGSCHKKANQTLTHAPFQDASALHAAACVVLHVLGETYLWCGSASLVAERDGASQLAGAIARGSTPKVLKEGQETSDFWKLVDRKKLPNPSCFDAYRPLVPSRELRTSVWKVTSSANECSAADIGPSDVSILASPLEIWVLVGADARSERKAIRAALDAAQNLAQERTSATLPAPRVHCLLAPTLLPESVTASFRGIDSELFQRGATGINEVSASAALSELATSTFDSSLLRDASHLPVGVSPADL